MVKKWSLQFYVSNHSVTLREFFYKPNSFFSFLHKYKGRPDQCSYDHVTSNVLHVQETEWQQIVTSRAISWWMRKKRERDRVDTRQRDISRCLGIFCVMSLVVISSLWYLMCVCVVCMYSCCTLILLLLLCLPVIDQQLQQMSSIVTCLPYCIVDVTVEPCFWLILTVGQTHSVNHSITLTRWELRMTLSNGYHLIWHWQSVTVTLDTVQSLTVVVIMSIDAVFVTECVFLVTWGCMHNTVVSTTSTQKLSYDDVVS